MSAWVVPIRPGRTIEMSRAWPCCWRGCRIACPPPPSIGYAARASMPRWSPLAASRPAPCELVIAGGVESMSRAPYVMAKAESAFARGARLEDTTLGWRFINPRLEALVGCDSMAQTAENLVEAVGHHPRRPGCVRVAQPAALRARPGARFLPTRNQSVHAHAAAPGTGGHRRRRASARPIPRSKGWRA